MKDAEAFDPNNPLQVTPDFRLPRSSINARLAARSADAAARSIRLGALGL